MRKIEAGQKLYYLLMQWVSEYQLSIWLEKHTGRANTTWYTFIRDALPIMNGRKSDMLDEFIEKGYILFMQLSIGRYPRTIYDIREYR